MPPSPSVQQSPVTQVTSPALGAAGSPLQTPGPLIASASGGVEAAGRRHETTRMRSSIACSRCRRSKTKCDNNGTRDSTGALAACKSCEASGKFCEYPAPQPPATSQPHRRESSAIMAGDELPVKKRKRPFVSPIVGGTPIRTKGDALCSPLLTPKVWDELWAIYEKHYAMEFPFLHKRTFLGPLQRLPTVQYSETAPQSPSQHTHDPALVLAFLTLTSPFHPELIAQNEKPADTATFYATAGRACFDWSFDRKGEAAMQQAQALLMIGYHEWTACKGYSGYMLIRTAVALAQRDGLQFDEDLDAGHQGEDAALRRDRFIRQESRRRTFWSCFIIDRYLSIGKRRPKILQIEDLYGQIQVPCSDKNFISGRAVRTKFFGETDAEYAKRRKETDEKAMKRNGGHKAERIEWEDRDDDGMLGRYMFALEHFSDVNKWANNGGRRSETEHIGPWNTKTTYYHLDKRLREIRDDLPEELRLTSINTENHVYGAPSATSRTYFMIHAILMLSATYLAPEYMPTFGFRLTKPQGPMDEPSVTEPLPDDQPDYWVEKAKECFEYVRDFVSVLQSFKERGLVVESPFMGHAVWRAAWAAMYCHHVPKMDPSHALKSKSEPNAWDITNQVLDSMKKKYKISDFYSSQLATVTSYYAEKRKAWLNNGGSPQSTVSENDGGLHEYAEKFEAAHKAFGSFQINDIAFSADKHYSRLSTLEQEEEPEESGTPPSPVVSFKTEGEEPRRSASTAPSTTTTPFTTVNPNATVPVPKEQPNGTADISNGVPTPYGPPTSQGQLQQQQPPQSYNNQPYGPPPAFNYPSGTPGYPPSTSQYSLPTTYAQTSGPSHGSGNGSYDPHALMMLETEGNRSLSTNDVPLFEMSSYLQGQQYFSTMGYPLEQQQQHMPYGPYTYNNAWTPDG
ncbi:fungal-specific transcription factor domain-containing protein [Boeremia exigua]|uniref:fungal-specific transcription factor domain-containing protein n=1 Tax=Boeremia exigua TaxID=749465 RepID=UPI001E8E01EA|nr:fungal-specific transcription factor domain-containing protein [Boeremia exigua]KAH6615115.1 fungal-specific transcription factor domain-containing protein [Boeremia exigua]